jgi:hypothetical protein
VAGRETGLLRHSLAPCHDTVRVCPSLLSEYFLSTHLVLHEQINTGPGWLRLVVFLHSWLQLGSKWGRDGRHILHPPPP